MSTYLIVIALAIGFTLLLSRFTNQSAIIIILAALLTSVSFQAFVYVQQGHLDPFFLIAFVVSLVIALIISGLTVLVMRNMAKSNNTNKVKL
jgi:heme/copper-type cytochrome/quinol oxidase subunit 4